MNIDDIDNNAKKAADEYIAKQNAELAKKKEERKQADADLGLDILGE